MRSHALSVIPAVIIAIGVCWAAGGCAPSEPEVAVSKPEPIALNPKFATPTVTPTETAEPNGPSPNGPTANGAANRSPRRTEISSDDLFVPAEATESNRETVPRSVTTDAQIDELLKQAKDALIAGESQPAAQAAWDAWKLKPTDRDQIADITDVLVRTRKFLPAISVVNRAIRDDRANGKARVLLAKAYLDASQGNPDAEKSLSMLQKSNQTLLDLQHAGQLKRYGRSGASMLLGGLVKQARLAAALGHRDETLNAIEVLYRGGFSQLHSLLDEPEFTKLKSDATFMTAVAEWQAEIRHTLQGEIRRRLAATESFDFDFDLKDTRGRRVQLSDFRGKVVLVDFWGTWCPPCRKEIPHLAKLSREYSQDIEVVGIAYEKALRPRWPKLVAAFIKKNEVPYPCLIGDNETKAEVPNFSSFPTMLFLDREGKVRLKLVGYHGYEQLDAIVDLLIADTDDA